MKTSIWSGICTAALFSVTIAAQQPSSSTQPPRPATTPTEQQPSTTPQSPAARSDNGASKVTITGCLQPAPEVPTGTAGTSGSSAGAAALEKFVLTNASATPATAAPGSASASDARTYRLVANESALAPHAGKKIEVTGTLDSPSASASPNPAPSGSSSSSTGTPKLVVESGKVISQSCAN